MTFEEAFIDELTKIAAVWRTDEPTVSTAKLPLSLSDPMESRIRRMDIMQGLMRKIRKSGGQASFTGPYGPPSRRSELSMMGPLQSTKERLEKEPFLISSRRFKGGSK